MRKFGRGVPEGYLTTTKTVRLTIGRNIILTLTLTIRETTGYLCSQAAKYIYPEYPATSHADTGFLGFQQWSLYSFHIADLTDSYRSFAYRVPLPLCARYALVAIKPLLHFPLQIALPCSANVILFKFSV
jgi:hypothetical protein